jgi:hypothetical protein
MMVVVDGRLPTSCNEVLDPQPETTLAIRRTAFRRLLSGRTTPINDAAVITGLPVETAREAADLVASVGVAEIDNGTIIGMDGLTTRHTDHRMTLNGVSLWTWCAYDIVGIAAALEADAVGVTACGMCGREIEVVIWRGDPEDNTSVGWLPEEDCSNIMAEFCPSALLFCSTSHLEQWRKEKGAPSGESLDLPALAERGRHDWLQLVA